MQTRFPLLVLVGALCLGLLAGCGRKRPVLYPNAHYKTVGEQASRDAVNDCLRQAEASVGEPSDSGEVAARTAKGGAVGAAGGAAAGAVFGHAGTGAAAGAAGAAAGSLVSAMFDRREPDPVFKGFVERCLREQGFEPIGWR